MVLEGAKAGWLVIILSVCWLDALLKMFPITWAFYAKLINAILVNNKVINFK